MDVVDVLVKARAKIASPENWGQGMEDERGGRLCIGQAAYDAAEELHCDAKPTWKYLCKHAPGSSVTSWNDAHERTHAQVLAFLDGLIATERAKRGTEKLIDDVMDSVPDGPSPLIIAGAKLLHDLHADKRQEQCT